MTALFYARGDESDNALMPGLVIYANAIRPALFTQLVDVAKSLLSHRRFNISALAIDLIENASIFVRSIGIVGQQTFDADGNIFETSCRVDPRPEPCDTLDP